LIISTFVSVSSLLVDAGHEFDRYINKPSTSGNEEGLAQLKHRLLEETKGKCSSKRHKILGERKEDLYFFAIGFNIAFNQVIYTLVFLYSIISPCVLLLGALYFYWKYIVDKYCLVMLYPKNYEGRGEISKNIMYFATGSIFMQ